MSNDYQVIIGDATGSTILEPRDWQSLDYVRAENDVGALTLVLPGDYAPGLFVKDGMIGVWRSVAGGTPYLDTDTLWMIRRRRWQYSARTAPTWTIYAVDLNSLLKRRTVDHAPDDVAYTDLLLPADDMGKLLVRQNLGALVLDPTRDESLYLDVQADATLAPIRHFQTLSRLNILKALQDLALWSYQRGTYLVFDIVCTTPPGSPSGPMKFEFRSYVGQRGNDHRYPGGSPPLLIGPDYNNLDSIDDDFDATDEITRGIGVEGTGATQAADHETDTARAGESPFNLIESVRMTTAPDANALQAEAQAELQSGLPRRWTSGKLLNTSGLLYGLDWKWGDFLTVQSKFGAADVHASRVHVHVERDSGDQIETILTGSIT